MACPLSLYQLSISIFEQAYIPLVDTARPFLRNREQKGESHKGVFFRQGKKIMVCQLTLTVLATPKNTNERETQQNRRIIRMYMPAKGKLILTL